MNLLSQQFKNCLTVLVNLYETLHIKNMCIKIMFFDIYKTYPLVKSNYSIRLNILFISFIGLLSL